MNNYEIFYNLHRQNTPLVLANVWNVTSAKIVEKQGYKALATSSAAVARTLGYEDGEEISFDEMVYVAKRIISSVNLPLSVDMETGYSNDINTVISNIEKLHDIGVVGINIEDSVSKLLIPAHVFCKKISAIKNHLIKNNMQLFINTRTDGFLINPPAELETTLERVQLYSTNGADGIFVPFIKEEAHIKQVTAATALPVNVLAMPGLPSPETLAAWGVHRVSMGSSLFRAHYNYLETLLNNINAQQSFAPLF
ncbi:MAG: isocitrate lyase/phosphoenolpyruvate mutase family protein [Panacibacter sp.]